MKNKTEEICDATLLKKEYCAHCKSRPEYELVESTFNGCPIIEILHNGGPIHEFDQHFRFGIKKALVVMSCLEEIKELLFIQKGSELDIENKYASKEGCSLNIEYFSELQIADKFTVKSPWLRLSWVLTNGSDSIGIGRKKANALVALEPKIREWINKYAAD